MADKLDFVDGKADDVDPGSTASDVDIVEQISHILSRSGKIFIFMYVVEGSVNFEESFLFHMFLHDKLTYFCADILSLKFLVYKFSIRPAHQQLDQFTW